MEPTQLTIEQQFELRTFGDQVARMSLPQAQDCLMKLRECMMLREATYKSMMKNQLIGEASGFKI